MFGGAQGSAGHDVEVAGVSGQIVGSTLDLEEDRGLEPAHVVPDARDADRTGGLDAVELHLLLEAVARHIGLNRSGHALDRFGNRLLVGEVAQGIDGVAHDQRRLGRIQHDDGLALGGTADDLDRLGRGLGELVDVGARAGTGTLARDRGDDLAVVHLGDATDCGDHRNRGLAAAGDHVDIGCVEVIFTVDNRDTVGTDRCRGQVNHADAGLDRTQEGVVPDVGTGAGGVEDDIDIGELGQAGQALDALVRGGDAHARGAGQTIAGRVDANHGAHLDVPAVAQDLDHQIGADIAAANDGGLEFACHSVSFGGITIRRRRSWYVLCQRLRYGPRSGHQG